MLLAPWCLAGLLAIGLPLWLHRIARQERITLPFASSMLLENSEVRDTSRRSLRYWLLLLTRIALLIALVLAFAQPMFKSNTPVETSQKHLHAIVLDASLSMQYGDRWQHALQEARKLIDALTDGDRGLLVLASGKKIELVAGPVLARDADTLRTALATLKPGVERLDYGALMSSSQAWLGKDELPTRLHLITDLQESARPLRFGDLQPPVNTQIELHAVDDGSVVSNMNIANIKVQGAQSRTLIVDVHASGETAAARQLILVIDDREQARKAVEMQSDGNTQIVFPGIELSPGAHRIHLSLSPHDALSLDDDYYAVIEHAEPKVLLITRDVTSDEAAYFAAAIGAQTLVPLTVIQSAPQTLAAIFEKTPLNDFSAVVIADSGILSTSEAKEIRQYIAAGGAALITLGPQAARASREAITDIEIRKTSDNEVRVASVDDSHPVLRDSSGWRAVRFNKHVDVLPASQDRTLISLEDQSPLLIERAGAGRLLLLTAPLDRTWNDLPIHPLFVRFIAAAAHYLTDQDATAVAHVIGTQLATGLNAGTAGQIFDPQGARVLALDDATHADRLTPTQLGIYEVRSTHRKRWLAVNADPRESDLAPMSSETRARWQTLNHDAPQIAATQRTAASAEKPRAYGFAILWLLAALVLLELTMANYRLATRRDGSLQS